MLACTFIFDLEELHDALRLLLLDAALTWIGCLLGADLSTLFVSNIRASTRASRTW